MWEKLALCIDENYGTLVDFEERFFICPECSEPIYESDWTDKDIMESCPICKYTWDI